MQNFLSRNSYKTFQSIDALEVYRDSVFCLCAPGDLEVRKVSKYEHVTMCIHIVEP